MVKSKKLKFKKNYATIQVHACARSRQGSRGSACVVLQRLCCRVRNADCAASLYAVVLQETVLLWEQLRPKQTTKEQKQQLVTSILKKVCVVARGCARQCSRRVTVPPGVAVQQRPAASRCIAS